MLHGDLDDEGDDDADDDADLDIGSWMIMDEKLKVTFPSSASMLRLGGYTPAKRPL